MGFAMATAEGGGNVRQEQTQTGCQPASFFLKKCQERGVTV